MSSSPDPLRLPAPPSAVRLRPERGDGALDAFLSEHLDRARAEAFEAGRAAAEAEFGPLLAQATERLAHEAEAHVDELAQASVQIGLAITRELLRTELVAGTHDIATLAVRPDWSGGRGLRISHALYCGLYRWAVSTGIEQFVGMLDLTPVELVRSIGVEVSPLCDLPALEYLGSPATIPVLISVIDTVAAMRVDPVLRDLLGGAAALDQFSMPSITLAGSWATVDGVPDAQPASDGDHIQL